MRRRGRRRRERTVLGVLLALMAVMLALRGSLYFPYAAAAAIGAAIALWPAISRAAARRRARRSSGGLLAWGLEAVSRRRMRLAGIAEIDAMDGVAFERRLALLFSDLGYQVRQTKARGDFGADLVLERAGAPRTVVQAKCYGPGRTIGVGAVQEAVAARQVYRAVVAMVVTNRTFTEPARRLAKANGVTLWEREDLAAALLRARPKGMAQQPDGEAQGKGSEAGPGPR